MHFPHTLLTLLVAVLLWGAAVLVAPAPPTTPEEVPAFAISGSAFGSLMARTVRSSLSSYLPCRDACCAPAGSPATLTPAAAPPPPPTPGVFARRRANSAPPAQPVATACKASMPFAEMEFSGPPLDRAAAWLKALETRRAQGQRRAPMSVAHQRFVNASFGWRLRLAYNLDPGDPQLYELLHYHILTTSQDIPQAQRRSHALTAKALAHAKSNQGGMADSLTGLGAAINAFNDVLLAAQPNIPSKEALMPIWDSIDSCQRQFHERRASAESEGWWSNIPQWRRTEIESHAALLDNLTRQIRSYLVTKGLLASHQ